jgi:hypothetical protein
VFDSDGNSISSAGEWPNSDQDICAAVAANIWLTLEKASRINPSAIQAAAVSGKTRRQIIGPGFLQFTVLEFDNGLLGVSRVEGTEFMITCLADSTCEFGMIKRKVLAVA